MSRPGKCPHCGKDLGYIYAGQVKYGSPIRTCPKCANTYVDRRYKELALNDLEQLKKEVTFAEPIIYGLFGAFMYYRSVKIKEYDYYNGVKIDDSFMPTMFLILALAFLVVAIVKLILILTGAKYAKFEKLYYESESRLCDKTYAHQLQDLGYQVPERFL